MKILINIPAANVKMPVKQVTQAEARTNHLGIVQSASTAAADFIIVVGVG